MKTYRFENTPLLKAFSKRPGSDNELDRRCVNERCNDIETDAVANENGCKCCDIYCPLSLYIFHFCFYGKKRNYTPGAGGRKSPRVSRCFSPPPPDVERVVRCILSEEFYTKKQSDKVCVPYTFCGF